MERLLRRSPPLHAESMPDRSRTEQLGSKCVNLGHHGDLSDVWVILATDIYRFNAAPRRIPPLDMLTRCQTGLQSF
jgi:hypothetical protein